MKIVTEKGYVGWLAYDDDTYDGPGSPIGWGHTEQEAIECLRELLEDDS